MLSTVEIFYNGQIHTISLTAMLLLPHKPHRDVAAAPDPGAAVRKEENSGGNICLGTVPGRSGSVWGHSMRQKARSMPALHTHWRRSTALVLQGHRLRTRLPIAGSRRPW